MSQKAFATLSLLTLLVAATGFAQEPLKTNIPFDFTVGKTWMGAGEYLVQFDIPGTVRIMSADHKTSCTVITIGVQTEKMSEAGKAGKLVFHRYGETYFFSQVWRPGYDQGREVPKSKAELEVARNLGGGQLANIRLAPQ